MEDLICFRQFFREESVKGKGRRDFNDMKGDDLGPIFSCGLTGDLDIFLRESSSKRNKD